MRTGVGGLKGKKGARRESNFSVGGWGNKGKEVGIFKTKRCHTELVLSPHGRGYCPAHYGNSDGGQ